MTTPNPDPTTTLSEGVENAWHRFIDLFEPLRPELYRYCRHLTRSPWEADDLVQDAMSRAFVMLGTFHGKVPNLRPWLFRVASNLWIDRIRGQRFTQSEEAVEGGATPEPRAIREAAGTLLSRLSPQERAAVVLKEAFGLSLEEVAEALSTSVGTVKSALHRGRGKLIEPAEDEAAVPKPAVLDAFCDAFNAGDLERLTSLLLDNVEVEVVRMSTQYGPETARKGALTGMLFGTRRLADPSRLEGFDLELIKNVLPQSPRCELRLHRGEWLTLHWYAHTDGEAVRAITRYTAEGDKLSRLRNYFYTPDVLAEVCGELNVPFRSNGIRYWKPTL